jgi:ankyrin repeat protein
VSDCKDILLCSAAAAGDLSRMNELLKEGVSPDAGDQRNSTPLFYAAGHGRIDAAARLLDAGADINARNLDGHTVLDSILQDGPPEMISWLEARGAIRKKI